jgi:chemotaxis protein histidine kinase CheA
MKNSDDKEKKIKVYNRVNRLKVRLGRENDSRPGHIDEKAVEEAQGMIATLCAECPNAIGGYLSELSKLWKEMRDMPESPERENVSKSVFTVAHEIKDIGSMCGYELTAHFAESLRDYIFETELNLDAQRVIIQAHLDAMQVAFKQGTQETDGPMAEELKRVVKIAIEKYS